MLKASYEILQSPDTHSFLVRVFDQQAFGAPYHFHPEYELTLITSGEGKRFVGNHMDGFQTGDLVLLGSNLPHCWKADEETTQAGSAGAIVIQFPLSFLGDDFFSKPELTQIQQLLKRSMHGIQFKGKSRLVAERQIKVLAEITGNFDKMIALLKILQYFSLSTEYGLLAPQSIIAELTRVDQQRINEVLAYVVENFRGQVSLDEAAKAARMSTTAFCKYFKKITRKTFMETVTEYRLNYAAQQLLHTDHAISTICFDSGFGDISHFNKTFKARMQLSPLHYRKKFIQHVQGTSIIEKFTGYDE